MAQGLQFKKGSQLIYTVNGRAAKTITITIESLNPPVFTYSYGENTFGRIAADTTALRTAMELHTQLTGQSGIPAGTGLWVSDTLYQLIRNSDVHREQLLDNSIQSAAGYVEQTRIPIKVDGKMLSFKNIGRERQSVKVNEQKDSLLVYVMEQELKQQGDDASAYMVKFLDNGENPFLTYFYMPDRKLRLELKEVINVVKD
jgi:hypothetical protein